MNRFILTFFLISGLIIVKTNGQSADKNILIQGDWYACGIKSIMTNDTISFIKHDSLCKNKDCIFLQWIIKSNGNFKSGWQQGCEITKIGYDLKQEYKWSFDKSNDLLQLRKQDLNEDYKILALTDKMLKVIRIK